MVNEDEYGGMDDDEEQKETQMQEDNKHSVIKRICFEMTSKEHAAIRKGAMEERRNISNFCKNIVLEKVMRNY